MGRAERILTALALVVGVSIVAPAHPDVAHAAASNCPSALYLYDNDGFVGPALGTNLRWTYLNLNVYGFDNRTESLRTGACPVMLYSGPYGSGAYKQVGPWQQVDLPWEWDNAISSIYIY